MRIAERKDRSSKHRLQRQLGHEPLEPRMLLTADSGWVFGVGGAARTFISPTDNVVDAAGNTYVTGYLKYNAVDFDPGPDVAQVPYEGSIQAFLVKYGAGGELLWVQVIEGSDGSDAYGLALDQAGNVFMVGGFWGTATFGNTILASRGERDIFVAKLDSDGNFQWSVRAGSEGRDGGSSWKGYRRSTKRLGYLTTRSRSRTMGSPSGRLRSPT